MYRLTYLFGILAVVATLTFAMPLLLLLVAVYACGLLIAIFL